MIRETIQRFKDRLLGRARAYNAVFLRGAPETEAVLRDLAKFCRAHDSTFHTDPRVHAVLEGRREVFLLIMAFLNLSQEELYHLHRVREIEGRE